MPFSCTNPAFGCKNIGGISSGKIYEIVHGESIGFHVNNSMDFSCKCVPVISKRQRITLRLLNAIAIPSVVCRLSVCLSVCDVGAPYSAG